MSGRNKKRETVEIVASKMNFDDFEEQKIVFIKKD